MKRAALIFALALAVAVPAGAQQQQTPELTACLQELDESNAARLNMRAQALRIIANAQGVAEERDALRAQLDAILAAYDAGEGLDEAIEATRPEEGS